MSIINEALKKALREKESIPTSTYQDSLKKKFESELPKRGPRITWKPIFAILIILLVAGPIIAPFLGRPLKDTPQAQSQAVKPVAADRMSSQKSQFGIEQTGLLQTAALMPLAPKSNFRLAGVLVSPDDSYCIINNKILRVGDNVQGAKLLSITPDGAILELNGKKISLAS